MNPRSSNPINGAIATALTVLKLLYNKWPLILVLWLAQRQFMLIEPDADNKFVEVYYSIILALWISILGPVIRLLLFPEAAEYAERGQLRRYLQLPNPTGCRLPAPLIHYWFATSTSFAIAGFCIATIAK